MTLIVALVPIVAFGFVGANVTVPYAATGPGPTINALGELDGRSVIELEGIEGDVTSGNFNLTTVAVRAELSLFDALGFWFSGRDGIVPIDEVRPPGRSNDEMREINRQEFERSELSAEVAALRYLDYPFVVTVNDLTDGSPSASFLKPGDILTTINGDPVASAVDVPDQLADFGPGEPVTIGFTRDGVVGEVTVPLGAHPEQDRGILGITVADEPLVDFNVTFNVEQVGGPSAGLMLSLALIDKLSPGELNGGRFIAGSGTIDSAGSVGPIGGIRYKLIAAKEAGATEFLVPADNCGEARKYAVDDLTLIRVEDLQGAISSIEGVKDGQEVPTC
ncbi:PDZ domain-containing protein [Hoyosella rhizosphaerae]|uniref:endopeptidase La n=1 Tax=Hoyosella rhizosphaerae TaxID=1755582 RepID=A0A916UAP9_9ACTN|nr:PDZ domain-containing protein [Hoyosella rhizosphaerae]